VPGKTPEADRNKTPDSFSGKNLEIISFISYFASQSTFNKRATGGNCATSKTELISDYKNFKMMKNKRLIIILAAMSVLLLIPFIAMQFTDEVDWSVRDFAIMGVLLYGTGLLCELVLRKVKTVQNRILICGAVVIAFLLIWAELAVGIFGTPFAGS